MEEKKNHTSTQETKYKYLDIYVFSSLLAPGDKRKGGCQDYKGFLLEKNGPKSPSFEERKGLKNPPPPI